MAAAGQGVGPGGTGAPLSPVAWCQHPTLRKDGKHKNTDHRVRGPVQLVTGRVFRGEVFVRPSDGLGPVQPLLQAENGTSCLALRPRQAPDPGTSCLSPPTETAPAS